MVVGFSFSVAVVFFGDTSEKIEAVAAIGDGVEVFVGFGGLWSKKGLFTIFKLADFHTAECKLVSVGIGFGIFQNGDNLKELALSHVAIGKQSSGLFVILFGEESLGEEGGVGVEVMSEGVVDGVDELGLEETVGGLFIHGLFEI